MVIMAVALGMAVDRAVWQKIARSAGGGDLVHGSGEAVVARFGVSV